MTSIRWFAPHDGFRSMEAELANHGLEVHEAGDQEATFALAMGDPVAEQAWSWSRRKGVPLILYLWDLPPWDVGARRMRPVIALGTRLVTLPWLTRGNVIRSGHFSRLRWIVRHTAEIWVPSRSTAAAVERWFGVSSQVVPYGVDADFFVTDPTVPRESSTLVCVAPLLPHGNHAALVRAAARSPVKLRVRFLGAGPERPGLELLASDLGVDCTFSDDTSPGARRAAYQRAGAVICPSRYEGFGASALEAMACGAPIVASDIPSHREILGDSANFFGLDDDAALAGALRRAREVRGGESGQLALYTLTSAAHRFVAQLERLTGAAVSGPQPAGR